MEFETRPFFLASGNPNAFPATTVCLQHQPVFYSAVYLKVITVLGSSAECSRFSGGVELRAGWIQTTSWSQPGAAGSGLRGVMGGAQGGALGAVSAGERDVSSGD